MTLGLQGLYTYAAEATLSDLELLLTSRDGFGLTTATPLQRAICRVLDGKPLAELATHPDVIEAFGGAEAVAMLPRVPPKELVLLAGIRGAKSTLAAAVAFKAAYMCDLSQLSRGDEPRASMLSVDLDKAKQTWTHVAANIQGTPLLRSLLIGEPKADSLLVRNRGGRAVEVKIVAGSRAASSLVSRWSVSFVADEAPRMLGADDGVVNLDHARIAIAGRLLRGAQSLLIGSPFAPFGPVYNIVQEHHGKPSAQMVVVRGRGPQMNPVWWTPENIEQIRSMNPDAARTDIDCEFLVPETSLFGDKELRELQRKEAVIPPEEGWEYRATMDPATRGNAWTLTIGRCTGRVKSLSKIQVVLARQWVGSKAQPLDPDVVLGEIAMLVQPYGVETIETDQWSSDALRSLAVGHKLNLREVNVSTADNVERFNRLAVRVAMKALELPPDQQIVADLVRVKKMATQAGIHISMPVTSDGRHCDYAPSLAQLCMQYFPDPPPAAEHFETPQHAEAAAWQKRLAERIERQATETEDDPGSFGFGPED